MSTKIEREKKTIKRMIQLYCKHRLKVGQIPRKYQQLLDYACYRLDHCSWGNNKPTCKDCPHHCYTPEKRKDIRKIMKWAGPRMLIWNPHATFRHFIQTWRTRLYHQT